MKKQSMIMEIYYGDRGRFDQIPMTEEYRELLRVAEEEETRFLSALNETEELKKLFKKTKDSIEALWSNECDSHFCEGFRIGVLLGMDVLQG